MAAKAEEPYKSHTQEHPFPFFNTLSAYDWIIYVPLHTIRHSKQMIEVMETEKLLDSGAPVEWIPRRVSVLVQMGDA